VGGVYLGAGRFAEESRPSRSLARDRSSQRFSRWESALSADAGSRSSHRREQSRDRVNLDYYEVDAGPDSREHSRGHERDGRGGYRGKENAPRNRGESWVGEGWKDDQDPAFDWIDDHDGAWPARKDIGRTRSRSSDDFGRERRYRDRERADASIPCPDDTRWVSVVQSPLRREDACSDRTPSLSGKDRYGDTAGFDVSTMEEFADNCARRYEVDLPSR
jgi:hypothetical protein